VDPGWKWLKSAWKNLVLVEKSVKKCGFLREFTVEILIYGGGDERYKMVPTHFPIFSNIFS